MVAFMAFKQVDAMNLQEVEIMEGLSGFNHIIPEGTGGSAI